MDWRIGQGYDVHRLVPERKLILCGVEIPSPLGLAGHSDADVAVHALMDAMLGALGLADIGTHFPDTDPAYAGCDSMLLLKKVLALPEFSCWRIGNLDLTIIAQKPKLSPWREAMLDSLARALALPPDRVSVKFTTTEHLGFTGRGEGIASTSVVLLCRE